MKFTKKQLLDALKEKLTENGKHLSISGKTISSLCDSHYEMLVNEETELTDFVEKILPQYVVLNGNYEKDNADFIKKWKSEHETQKLDEEKKIGDENIKTQVSDNEDALLKRIEALEAENAKVKTEKLISSKRSEILSKIKEKGVKDSNWANAYLSKINLSEDADVEKEVSDAVDFYNMSHTDINTVTPGSASAGSLKFKNGAERWAGVNKAIQHPGAAEFTNR